jgi:hypothetical protein
VSRQETRLKCSSSADGLMGTDVWPPRSLLKICHAFPGSRDAFWHS